MLRILIRYIWQKLLPLLIASAEVGIIVVVVGNVVVVVLEAVAAVVEESTKSELVLS